MVEEEEERRGLHVQSDAGSEKMCVLSVTVNRLVTTSISRRPRVFQVVSLTHSRCETYQDYSVIDCG